MTRAFGTSRAGARVSRPGVTVDSSGRITSITVGGRTWTCAPTPIFDVRTWTTGSALFTFTTYDATSFSVTTSTDANGVLTVTASKSHLGGTISFTGTITPDQDAQTLSATCSVTNTGSCAIAAVSFPRFAPLPPSGDPANVYMFRPIGEGYVKRAPNAQTANLPLSMPAAMHFFSIYDAFAKSQLYIERRFVDDTVIPYMVISTQGGASGNSDSVTIEVQHIPQAGRTYGNSYTQSSWYTVTLSSVETTGDGRAMFQDACDKYAEYALARNGANYSRSWMQTDAWWNRFDYSSKIAAMRIFTRTGDNTAAVATGTTTPDYAFYQTEFTRLKANAGAGTGVVAQNPAFWHANIFDTDLPAHTPQRGSPAFNNHIAAITAAGGITIAYVVPVAWTTSLTSGTYNVTSYTDLVPPFTNFGDMRTGMFKDTLGNIQNVVGVTGTGTFDPSYWAAVSTDPASGYTFGSNGATSSYIIANLMARYVADAVGCDAFYLDVVSGHDGFTYQNFAPGAPFGGGNHGKVAYGKMQTWRYTYSAAKGLFGTAMGFIGESPQEAMLRSIEATNFYDSSTTVGIDWGVSCAAWRRIYGDFQRAYSFSPQIVDQDIGKVNRHIQQCFCNYLRTGMLSFLADTPAKTPLFDGNTDYTNVAVKLGGFALVLRLCIAATAYTDPYVVKGKLLRPTRLGFELDAFDLNSDMATFTQTQAIDIAATKQLPHAVYKHQTLERWGIVALNHILDPATFRIVLDTCEYGMPSGEKILYRNNLDGTSTELTRFRHHLDYDATVQLRTLALFEIVPA